MDICTKSSNEWFSLFLLDIYMGKFAIANYMGKYSGNVVLSCKGVKTELKEECILCHGLYSIQSIYTVYCIFTRKPEYIVALTYFPVFFPSSFTSLSSCPSISLSVLGVL